ncbi:MAG: serine hydrolase [Phycisphaeraceae bacterium]|nr:serine hydrolase [Phycisphaeraceae bacterium]
MSLDWTLDAPADHQLDPQALEDLKNKLAEQNTASLLVMRQGRVMLEWYAPGRTETARHYTASAAKGLVGGLSLLIALADGALAIDELAAKWVPAWREDPLKSRITVRQLATHTSGLEDANQDGVEHKDLPGWMGAFWRRELDPFTISRDQVPVKFEPGTARLYSNPGMAMLSYVVTASLRAQGRHPDIRQALAERVMGPAGVSEGEWSIGYNQTYEVDGLPLVANWGGGEYTARAMATLGEFVRRLCVKDGQSLFPVDMIKLMAGPAESRELLASPPPERQPIAGLGWWCNARGAWPTLTRRSFCAAGAGHQLLLVVPELEMVVVRQGGNLGTTRWGQKYWEAAYHELFEPLTRAFLPPAPASPVIKTIAWDPPETITRHAHDSDIWSNTWADDGHIYTAYGDGQGFYDPPVPGKLSMGIARVEGDPPNHKGVNVRAETAEFKGNGPVGPKPCGMLMIRGVLYMLVRNDDRKGCATRLAWSADHGATWMWADWRFDEFGVPTFINFGRDYEGARDHYVYLIGHDNPSAYREADGYVLFRVDQDKLRQREAYEFFAGLDGQGAPRWSPRIEDRQPMLTHRGRSRRVGVNYVAGLNRYLMWAQISRAEWESDTRFAAGFAVFDAPEPWGPWTTAYYTEQWDVGPGDTGSFPAKWTSADGKRLHLVFSGNDYFSVRGARIVTHA